MISIEQCADQDIIQRILYHPHVMHGRSLSDGFRPDAFTIPTGLYLLARSNGVPMGLFLLACSESRTTSGAYRVFTRVLGQSYRESAKAGDRVAGETYQFQGDVFAHPRVQRKRSRVCAKNGLGAMRRNSALSSQEGSMDE
jgi:hypothetical protein